MAQIETTGGGVSYTPDGKKVTRQVYVLTEGTTSVDATSVTDATITSTEFAEIGAGSQRVTVTWTQGLSAGGGSGGGAGSAGGGATVELAGGAREVPIQAHKVFQAPAVTDDQKKEITRAIAANESPDPVIVPTSVDNKARELYNMLFRGQEFYFTPAITYRETTLDTDLPTMDDLCTVNAPNKAPSVASGQNWLLISINGRSVASPDGTIKYEITREWMLSDRKGWDPRGVIYDGN